MSRGLSDGHRVEIKVKVYRGRDKSLSCRHRDLESRLTSKGRKVDVLPGLAFKALKIGAHRKNSVSFSLPLSAELVPPGFSRTGNQYDQGARASRTTLLRERSGAEVDGELWFVVGALSKFCSLNMPAYLGSRRNLGTESYIPS